MSEETTNEEVVEEVSTEAVQETTENTEPSSFV